MQRPRIKYEHRPRRLGDGRVRIGGRIYGLAAEMRDPDGQIWAMLELLDGSRTVDQVVTHLVHQFPALSPDEARSGVEQVIAAGYIEDASELDPVELNPRERERYSRSRGLFQWMDLIPRDCSWHAQLRLRAASVIIIGIGGTGSTAAFALAASGVGHLHCVEPDTVELSNLNRQVLYTEADLGRPKLDAALERLRRHNSDVKVTGKHAEVTGPDMLTDLIQGYDLLVMSADRPSDIRTWASQASLKTGIPWVHGGYSGPLMTTGCYVPGEGPCYDCVRITGLQAEPETVAEWGSTDIPSQSANAVSCGITGYLVAHMAMSALTGVPPLLTNCTLAFSLVRPDHTITFTADGPRADCPTCGGIS